jgi:hypothetical protein
MGRSLHGNAESQRKDRIIREELRSRNYMVFEITQTHLDDYKAMAGIFYRLGAVLLGKDRAAEVKEERAWFE